jgi:hypothetical protein
MERMGWKIVSQSPHSPDLAHSDFNLLGPMKVHLGGQKFRTDGGLKCSVLNWQHSQDKTLYAAGISNLSGSVKNVFM